MWVGLILAGGTSRRMGTDKAAVEVDGVAMVDRVGRALAETVDEVWLSLRHGQEHPSPGLPVVRDAGAGPLGGLSAGLARLSAPDAVLAVAVDMPFVTPSLLAEVRAALGQHEAAVPLCDGVPQVACAAWAARLADRAAALTAAGEGAPRALLAQADAVFLPADHWRDQLRSVDTPYDIPPPR